MNVRRTFIVLSLLLVATFTTRAPLASTAEAAGQTTATLTGRVLDTSGAALPGTQITARQVETGLQRTTTSDAAGRFGRSRSGRGPAD